MTYSPTLVLVSYVVTELMLTPLDMTVPASAAPGKKDLSEVAVSVDTRELMEPPVAVMTLVRSVREEVVPCVLVTVYVFAPAAQAPEEAEAVVVQVRTVIVAPLLRSPVVTVTVIGVRAPPVGREAVTPARDAVICVVDAVTTV